MNCPNLKALYGRTYKVSFDPAYDPKGIKKLDPWMMQIQGRKGTIYPWGASHLAVEVDRHPGALNMILALPSVVHVQDGSHEHTVVFPLGLVEAVLKIIQPRKRRKATQAQRERMRILGKKQQAQRLESKIKG